MCLIVLRWDPSQLTRLVVAANRVEFHARPSAPAGRWHDAPEILAGRDLQAGGTWLGVADGGRFAALTNYRECTPQPQPQPRKSAVRSRGMLVADFLRGVHGRRSASEYAAGLGPLLGDYMGFSLLLCDGAELVVVSNRFSPERPERRSAVRLLPPGLYGLSNGQLDDPWPKVERTKARLAWLLLKSSSLCDAALPPLEPLLDLLRDEERPPDELLPQTGVGVEMERFLSPPFIVGEDYGTRCSTAVVWGPTGLSLQERRFGPTGALVGESGGSTSAD